MQGPILNYREHNRALLSQKDYSFIFSFTFWPVTGLVALTTSTHLNVTVIQVYMQRMTLLSLSFSQSQCAPRAWLFDSRYMRGYMKRDILVMLRNSNFKRFS